MFGSAVVGFALAWYLARETGSATILSTAVLANMIPQIAIGPFIGPFIDRWNRKKVIIYSDLITALLTLALVVLFYTDTAQIWHIYVIMTARSVGIVFQDPALRASMPMVVPEQHLVRANGLFMTLRGAINLTAPAAGAFLMEALDVQWVLSVDIITAVIAIACLLPLGIPQPPRSVSVIKPGYLTEMKEGLRYITSRRGLLYFITLDAVLSFFAAPSGALLPLFVVQYFNGDVLKLGWLQTASGAGLIAGGLIIGAWGGFKKRIVTTLTGLMVQAVAVFLFGFTMESLFFLALALRFIASTTGAMFMSTWHTILQSVVAKDMQGRVFSLEGSLSRMMMPIGLIFTGPVTDAIGLRPIWWGSAAAIFVITGLAFFSRELMNIENGKAEELKSMAETPAQTAR